MDCELRQRGTLVKRGVVCIAIFALFVMQAPAQTNPLRDSVAIVTEKLEYAPDSEELLLKRAGYNIELEQWDYAKTDYDRVLRRNPNNLTALFFRAYVNERLGRSLISSSFPAILASSGFKSASSRSASSQRL